MRWLKREIWKAGIALAGMLLLLVLMVWVPVSAGAHEMASGLATPGTGTAQATPTEDATVAALNKEKLAQEVQQLKNQNEPDFFGWLRTNASILLSTLVVVIGGLIGLFRWLADRRDEHEKRRQDQQREQKKQAEQRFQSVVEGLGSEREEARVGAAITLRTFLLPEYEQFYRQVFDLAVAHLRLPRTSQLPADQDIPLPSTSLSQALIMIFKEAFPLARSQNTGGPQSLDATGIQLDNAYLRKADLKQVWMPQASLRKVDLHRADLSGAELEGADLSGANLRANLSGANLREANLRANLREANLREANLREADFSGANLREANLSGADLSKANLEDALSLKGTDLRGVKGLTKEQLEACKAKGAIVDEIPPTSSSQSPVAPPAPEPRSEAQAPSPTPAQGRTSTAGTDESSTTSSKPGNGAQAPSPTPAQVNTPPPDTDRSSAPPSKLGPEP